MLQPGDYTTMIVLVLCLGVGGYLLVSYLRRRADEQARQHDARLARAESGQQEEPDDTDPFA